MLILQVSTPVDVTEEKDDQKTRSGKIDPEKEMWTARSTKRVNSKIHKTRKRKRKRL